MIIFAAALFAMAKKQPKKTATSRKAPEPVRVSPWAMLLLFGIGAILLYGRTYNYGYVLDDDVVYVQNTYVQEGLAGIDDIVSHGFIHGFNRTNDQSYRPIVLIVFALEKELLGNEPGVQHFINALLYGLCAFLLWLIMRRLFRQRHPAVPILIALVFLAHPVHTEVVANIKGHDDLLHFLFAMGALLFSLRFVDREEILDLVLAGVLFFLALLSKEVAITFLAIIPLTAYFFTDAKSKTIAINGGVLLVVLTAYMGIRAMVLDEVTFDEDMKVINNALAAADGNPMLKYSTVLTIIAMYVKLSFLPHPLSWEYGYNQIPIVGPGDWQTILSILLLVGLGVYAVIGLKKRDPIAWGILFFFITLSIVSNLFIEIGATFAERFLFTPSVGFSVALVLLLARITRVDLSDRKLMSRYVFTVPLAVILLLFSVKTVNRSADWEDSDTLFLSALDATPNSSRVWSAVGSVYRVRAEQSPNPQVKNTNYTKAITHYQRSLEILDSNFDSWYNMGVCYHYSNRPEQAMEAYQRVVEIEPNFVNAWNNIGSIQFNSGNNYEAAKESFNKVIAIDSTHSDALTNLGACYHNEGDMNAAVGYYEKALKYNPRNQNALNNIITAYNRLGNAERVQYYQSLAGRPAN